MKANLLVGALVAAGVLGTGAAAYRGHWSPVASVQANPAVLESGVAAPAVNPNTSSLPLNGFSDLVKAYGPAVVNVQVEGTVRTSNQMQGIPDDVPEVSLSGAPVGLPQLLRQTGLCASSSEAMRMIDQGGVRIDGTVVSDKALQIQAGSFVLQVGKRKFARVTLAAGPLTA